MSQSKLIFFFNDDKKLEIKFFGQSNITILFDLVPWVISYWIMVERENKIIVELKKQSWNDWQSFH